MLVARVVAMTAIVGLLAIGMVGMAGCDSNTVSGSQNGFKPPPPMTAAQQKQDLEARIKAIQDNPNIPEQSKQMIVAQMRATAASPPPSLPERAANGGK